MKNSNFTYERRVERLEVFGDKKTDERFYLLWNHHLFFTGGEKEPCLLCGKMEAGKDCSNRLDDIGLHIFAEEHKDFPIVLYLAGKTLQETGYTDFIPNPDWEGKEKEYLVFVGDKEN